MSRLRRRGSALVNGSPSPGYGLGPARPYHRRGWYKLGIARLQAAVGASNPRGGRAGMHNKAMVRTCGCIAQHGQNPRCPSATRPRWFEKVSHSMHENGSVTHGPARRPGRSLTDRARDGRSLSRRRTEVDPPSSGGPPGRPRGARHAFSPDFGRSEGLGGRLRSVGRVDRVGPGARRRY